MKISKHEKILMTYVFEDIKCYAVTRDVLGRYTLYKILGDDYQKLKTAETPLDFDEIVKKDRSK
jgi:hypothetical protein